jgi:hypothetical protein
MNANLLGSLSLVDASGYLIIAAILLLLALGVTLTLVVLARYAHIDRDLGRHADPLPEFGEPVLSRIAQDVREVVRRQPGEVQAQAIVEHRFQTELAPLLLAERFVKASTGLMIIMGLVGTFYGLTLSIGKLAALVSGDAGATADIAASVTAGLTQALSGMSVAFSTSLFGIGSAIVMTVLGVFANLAERRTALVLSIEVYLETVLIPAERGAAEPLIVPAEPALAAGIAELAATVRRFEAALAGFSANTRDFHEFNVHLKDNIQRMSLSFADLGDTLQRSADAHRCNGRG